MEMKKSTGRKRNFGVFIGPLVILLAFIVPMILSFREEQKEYTLDDMVYRVTSEEVVLDVTVKDIRKEKGREDSYTVLFKEFDDDRIRLTKSMPKSEFEKLVGTGNNTVRTKMHTLTLAIPKRLSLNKAFIMDAVRFDCFGQSTFTEFKVAELAQKFLETVNATRSEVQSTYDSEKIIKASQSEWVDFYQGDVKDLSDDFKEIPNVTVKSKKDTIV